MSVIKSEPVGEVPEPPQKHTCSLCKEQVVSLLPSNHNCASLKVKLFNQSCGFCFKTPTKLWKLTSCWSIRFLAIDPRISSWIPLFCQIYPSCWLGSLKKLRFFPLPLLLLPREQAGLLQHFPTRKSLIVKSVQRSLQGFVSSEHTTLYHFWDQLSWDLEHKDQVCKICQLRCPTQDHLVQHMGNFHSYVNCYLIREGLGTISSEKTIRLLYTTCYLCNASFGSSSHLKNHMSVKHFQRKLRAEWEVVKSCLKCYKPFEGASVTTVKFSW